jgi:hypothetical protein
MKKRIALLIDAENTNCNEIDFILEKATAYGASDYQAGVWGFYYYSLKLLGTNCSKTCTRRCAKVSL